MTRISDSGFSVAIVGATGQVGTVMREILSERSFPIRELRLFSSARSAGSAIEFGGVTVIAEDVETADPAGIEIALFSVGLLVGVTLAATHAFVKSRDRETELAMRLRAALLARRARYEVPALA